MVLQLSPQEYFGRRVSATVVSPPAYQEPIIPSNSGNTFVIGNENLNWLIVGLGVGLAIGMCLVLLFKK